MFVENYVDIAVIKIVFLSIIQVVCVISHISFLFFDSHCIYISMHVSNLRML